MSDRALYQHLTPDYMEKVTAKWERVLAAGPEIKDEYVKQTTAMILENTEMEFKDGKMLLSEDGMSAAAGGAFGTTFDYGANDARIPSIVIPTVRRIFPELLAHDCVGVQPMNGPVGFAYALRMQYGAHGRDGGVVTAQTDELGYNNMSSSFTGASGNGTTGNYWESYAGAANASLYGGKIGFDGQGASLASSEAWGIGTDFPQASFGLLKGIVEAKSRKLAAYWSLELAEDMAKMQGINTETEMTNAMSYEIQAEIDRQLVTEMVKSAIAASHVSTWSPVSADGRNQIERIATLYTQVLDKSNEIAVRTRRGAANFAITSPKVAALLERLGDFRFYGDDNAKVQSGTTGIAKVGTLRQGSIKVYRDTFAGGNYVLLGYKGPTPQDSGIVFCPYIPLQLLKAIDPNTFSPRIGARTRYGILSHLFGSGNFYHFIMVSGLTSVGLVGDSSSSRIFTY